MPTVPIVGIGASAGGIEAFRGFFEHMPPDSGLCFVVVLHLPSHRRGILPEILSRWTAMRVIEIEDGCAAVPNCVFVPPSGVSVTLREGRLRLHEATTDEPRELSPISLLLDSLAAGLGEDATGIVLSGTGSDGALGLKAIKAAGGLTLAQGTDGTGPQHGGMPASAIATGAVDIVAPVEAMPGHLIAVRDARLAQGGHGAIPPDGVDAARLAICNELHRHVGHDFSGYKDRTFMRRVRRRMNVLTLLSLDDYIARLRSDRGEVVMLFRDLLIGVTGFFRDADTFDVIERSVVPKLFENRSADATVRVWVAGCATGEEAYSLAILLREHAQRRDAPAPKVQVFATDIDEAAIATARIGRYPATLLSGVTQDRLARHFVAGNDGSYTVAKDIRDLCTFSAHSLTRDPPFSRIDLVSCRNLLIYLDADLQASVIPAFHYALVPDGMLLLGSSETASRHESLFGVLDRSHRVYRRRDAPSPPLSMTGRTTPHAPHAAAGAGSPGFMPARAGLARATDRASARVMERYAPVFVVVERDGGIVQYSSRTGRYLEPAPGLPVQNLFVMARPGLRAPLKAALRQAVETGRPAAQHRVPVELSDDTAPRISLIVEPLPDQGSGGLFLVVFNEQPSADWSHGEAARGDETRNGEADGGAASPAPAPDDTRDYARIDAELRDTREQLQSVIEEHETALEELRSANEELHSVNEELQSTNEELETSKEEIQSINEELQTVNGQLASKVDEMDRRNTDLLNLFESTQVATIFLDPYLVIRGFTPAVASIYNLIPGDHGRPLTDIVSQLRYDGLRDDVNTVLATLAPLERRVARLDDAAHYLMRVLPYRRPDDTVDGTLVTFVDVTSMVQAENHQRLLVDELNHRVKNMLTVVISLAAQTLRRSADLEEFGRDFLGRVHALSAAYSLLGLDGWTKVSLRELVGEEVKPFLSGDGTNIAMQGPRVLLKPRAALALGMAVHELTTNAVKHGALSVPGGRVRVNWGVETDGKDDMLVLDWIETGGPPITAPKHRGFGMTLIERGLRQDISAQVDLAFPAEGVRARVQAPMRDGAALASSDEAPDEGSDG